MVTYFLYMVSPIIIYLALTGFYNGSITVSDKRRKSFLMINGFVMFFMIACMDLSVGSGDAVWYYNSWSFLSKTSLGVFIDVVDTIDIERGYLVTVWLLSHVFKDPQFVFVFSGLFFAVSVSRFLYLNCKYVLLGIVMFNCLGLWAFMAQGIRQGIAMCICLYAIEYCKQRKLLKFLLLVFLSALFHASSVVFVVVYFLYNFRMNLKGYAVTIAIAFVSFIMAEELFGIINFFINDTFTINEIDKTSGGVVSVIIYGLIIVAALYFYSEHETEDARIRLFFFMVCFGFLFFIMRYSVSTITQRISYYFMFAQMPMLSFEIQNLNKRDRFIASSIVIVLCLGITIYKSTYTEMAPFLFFWQA